MGRRAVVLLAAVAVLATLPAAAPAQTPFAPNFFSDALQLLKTNVLEKAIAAEQRALRAKSKTAFRRAVRSSVSILGAANAFLKTPLAQAVPGFSALGSTVSSAIAADNSALRTSDLKKAKAAVRRAIAAKRRAIGQIPKIDAAFCGWNSSGAARAPFSGNAFHIFDCSRAVTSYYVASNVPLGTVQGPIRGTVTGTTLKEEQFGTCTKLTDKLAKCTPTSPVQPVRNPPGDVFLDTFFGVPPGTMVEALLISNSGFQVTRATAR